jgi:hypothetical protein
MTDPGLSSFFAPSERALAFGEQYAVVLARWGQLFEAAAALTQANVELGRMASDAAREFEGWVAQTAAMPWSWMSPDALQQFLRGFAPKPPAGG